jgi:prevent-host-death family protein
MNKHTRVWSLQNAKARLSEVIRLAQSEGPQLVTVHGKSAVTIAATPTEMKPERKLTGEDLWKALAVGPKFEMEIPERAKDGLFREVDL